MTEYNPYINCPAFENDNFLLRKVVIEDADSLFECYSDTEAVALCNTDSSINDFLFESVVQMRTCIRFWLMEYNQRRYVRFSVVDKHKNKAVGTIEIFKKGTVDYLDNVGIMRLDLSTAYENVEVITDILQLASENFYLHFSLDYIATKAVDTATKRITALQQNDFFPLKQSYTIPHDDYYVRSILTPQAVAKSIGFCGLICALCHKSSECGGCKSDNNCCGRHKSEQGCFQHKCCTLKELNGCWECELAPCDNDMFSAEHSLRNRVFVKFAKDNGIDTLAKQVLKNQLGGIIYGWQRDYDNLSSDQEIIDLLSK